VSDTAALYLLIAALITATGTIFGALLWLVRPRFEQSIRDVVKNELKPVMTQLSENSHKNLIPTIPDLISNVQHSIQRVLGDITAVDVKVDGLDSKVDQVDVKVDDVRTDFDRHLLDREEAKQLMRTLEAIALSQPPPDLGPPTTQEKP